MKLKKKNSKFKTRKTEVRSGHGLNQNSSPVSFFINLKIYRKTRKPDSGQEFELGPSEYNEVL
jgi:hypothetical protein